MKMDEVRKKARALEVKVGRMKKKDLIRAVQLQEGNTPCFQVDMETCDQDECCWRSDCRQGN